MKLDWIICIKYIRKGLTPPKRLEHRRQWDDLCCWLNDGTIKFVWEEAAGSFILKVSSSLGDFFLLHSNVAAHLCPVTHLSCIYIYKYIYKAVCSLSVAWLVFPPVPVVFHVCASCFTFRPDPWCCSCLLPVAFAAGCSTPVSSQILLAACLPSIGLWLSSLKPTHSELFLAACLIAALECIPCFSLARDRSSQIIKYGLLLTPLESYTYTRGGISVRSQSHWSQFKMTSTYSREEAGWLFGCWTLQQ